jgi:hypothetical protein
MAATKRLAVWVCEWCRARPGDKARQTKELE